MNRVAGKVAIVTGGARGIGRADALKLASEGARVIVADIDEAGGQAVAAEAPGIEFVRHDVRDEAAWQELVHATVTRHGRLDVLVNNAGVIHVGDPLTSERAETRHMFEVNVDGTMLGCKYAIPAMIDSGGGSIINMSSIASSSGLYFFAGYCATKGAIAAYTKVVAVYCAQNRLNIRCNSIHPGGIDTPMNTGLEREFAAKIAGMRLPANSPVSADAPKMRYGQPDDIAFAVVYLASDESRFTSGAEFYIENTSTITAAVVG
ncbi:MAG: SDR family oxidoreductase [Proteobacteria bacterium]|nr:SDR family oxidoreductase [Pseudomonadota bacterium]